jgi:hypothetical protein
LDEHRKGIEVIYGDVEKSLQLLGVQIHRLAERRRLPEVITSFAVIGTRG